MAVTVMCISTSISCSRVGVAGSMNYYSALKIAYGILAFLTRDACVHIF